MNALEWARQNVFFWQSSPIAGKFDDSKYPFVRAALLRLSDIDCKTLVQLGPSQSLKTVLLQIACAYALDYERCSCLAVAQTDDDAKDFYQVKLEPFLSRIASLVNSRKPGKSSQTQSKWLWPSHELVISGPGENAQNSKSVRRVLTDEAHLWCIAYPNAMTALDGRMGERWDRQGFHATTAPIAGTEIDVTHAKGNMGEWNLRCLCCNKLIEPLWEEDAKAKYNGEEVFHWKESENEDEKLSSIHIICPHCQKEIRDTVRNRIEMDEGAQYIDGNPNASRMFGSYRWNCFAPRWKSWSSLFSIYLKAIQSVKFGNLDPWQEWVQKYLVRPWTGQFPLLGRAGNSGNYYADEVKPDPLECRTLSADWQAGIGNEGKHGWALVEQWDREGNSKRLLYRKFTTFHDLKLIQMEYKVEDKKVGVDCGHEYREVLAACSQYHWVALKSGDETEFAHVHMRAGQVSQTFMYPFSPETLANSNIGKHEANKLIKNAPRGKHCPPGWAIVRNWSKPAIYALLYNLKQGMVPREYGIAKNINPDFTSQLHSYVPQSPVDTKTNLPKKIVWVCTKPKWDHSFVCAAQGLLLAILAGFYPVSTIDKPKEIAA